MKPYPVVTTPQPLTAVPHLNLFSASVETGGAARPWVFASRKAGPASGARRPDAAVMIVLVRSARDQTAGPSDGWSLVLTREFRVPLRAFEISVPSGLVDAGEDVAQAAARELREETGLTLTRIAHISPPVASSAGMTDETVALVYGEAEGKISAAGQTEQEDIEVMLVGVEEIRRLLRDPGEDVISSRIYSLLLHYAQAGTLALPV